MKYYGYFTKQAAKAIKGDRIMCRTYDDGHTIYLCNGYVLYKCSPADYDAIFRAALGRDPGDWSYNKGIDAVSPCDWDAAGMMEKSAQAATHKMERVALEFQTGGKPAAATIAEDRSFTALFNPAFLDAVENCDLFSAGKAGAAIYAREGDPVALIMPVKINEAQDRTIRAFVDAPEKEDRPAVDTLEQEKAAAEARADALTNELVTLRAALEKSQAEAVELSQELEAVKQQMERETAPVDRSRLAELVEAAAAEYKAEQAAQDMTPAQKAVARVEALGLTATIKGAQTAAPVVWINGGEDRAEDLKKAGAVWSAKRSAYYIRVA